MAEPPPWAASLSGRLRGRAGAQGTTKQGGALPPALLKLAEGSTLGFLFRPAEGLRPPRLIIGLEVHAVVNHLRHDVAPLRRQAVAQLREKLFEAGQLSVRKPTLAHKDSIRTRLCGHQVLESSWRVAGLTRDSDRGPGGAHGLARHVVLIANDARQFPVRLGGAGKTAAALTARRSGGMCCRARAPGRAAPPLGSGAAAGKAAGQGAAAASIRGRKSQVSRMWPGPEPAQG